MRWSSLAVLLVLTAGCGQGVSDAGTSRQGNEAGVGPVVLGAGAWTRVPDPPLTVRDRPVAAAVGGEAVFVGGYSGPPCPPTADCVVPEHADERDGAAYDPATNTWRRIADAPRAVPGWSPTAVVGARLYIATGQTLLVWDSIEDSWQEVPAPRDAGQSLLAADGDQLVLASGSDEHCARPDHVLDTTTGEWTTLPEDPLKPSFDRVITSTRHGLVLTAKPIGPDGGPADPALVHAALLAPGESEWRTLPASDQLGGWRWAWTGKHLVDPTLGGADGGQVNNFGRVIPFGGRLDPATGTWSRLPGAPDERTGGWPVEVAGGPLIAAEGWLYDDNAGSWTRLPRPADAPAEPGPGAWVGRVLVVYGGADWDRAAEPDDWTPENVWSTGSWVYQAPVT
jgi:hypothetical protein